MSNESYNTAVPDDQWNQIKTWGNQVFSEAKIIILKWSHTVNGGNVLTGFRFKAGGEIIGVSWHNVTTTITGYGIAYLPAGTYEFTLEAYNDDSSLGKSATCSGIYVGYAKLGDWVGLDESAVITAGATNNYTTVTVANRTSVGGALNQAQFWVMAAGLFDPADVEIYVDSVLKTWAVSVGQDTYDVSAMIWYGPLSVGSAHTIGIKNVSGASKTVRVFINASPWLLGTEHQPLTLNFPQGSTLYVKGEPLVQNPSKILRLGKIRAITWGTDYYGSATGAGELDLTYTFDDTTPDGLQLLVSGVGGCISFVGVDVR